MTDKPREGVYQFRFCASGWARTSDLRFSGPTLYPAELRKPQKQTPEALVSFRRFLSDGPQSLLKRAVWCLGSKFLFVVALPLQGQVGVVLGDVGNVGTSLLVLGAVGEHHRPSVRGALDRGKQGLFVAYEVQAVLVEVDVLLPQIRCSKRFKRKLSIPTSLSFLAT